MGSRIHTHKQGSPIVESPYGGFHQWGYPNSWMVDKGKSHYPLVI